MMLFSDKELNPNDYSPLPLAYLGDCVYDLFVRTRLLERGDRQVTQIHSDATKIVNAAAQSSLAHAVEPQLSEEEMRVLKWGRNAKSNTTPKHATLSDYHWATGLETLIGYLYMKNETERLYEIMNAKYNTRRGEEK